MHSLQCASPGHMEQQQQEEAPSFLTLPGNILQDIATCLDGHSLLALLRTCHTLRNSHALRGSLLEAVGQQLDALRAALLDMLDAVRKANALLQLVRSLSQARPPLTGDPSTSEDEASRLSFGLTMLMQKVSQERSVLKAMVVSQMHEAKAAVQLAKAAGQSEQQALATGHQGLDVQAPLGRPEEPAQTADTRQLAAGQPGLHAGVGGLQDGQGEQAAGQSEEPALAVGPRAQEPEQDLGTIVMQARDAAVDALVVQQACPEVEQLVQGILEANGLGQLGREDLRAVVEVWLEGQHVQQTLAQMIHIIEQAVQGAGGLVVQQAVQQAAPAGQQPGEQLAQQAQQAQQAVPVGELGRRPALQAALHALVAGQPEAGLAVQAAVQARAQLLMQFARQTLQDWVQAGQARLQRVGNHDDDDMSALEATVQAAQRALQA